MVAGVRRTGSAALRAPPVITKTPPTTRMAAVGNPIRSQRRTCPAGPASVASGERLIRRAARSAFFASIGLNPNTSGNAR